MLKNFALTTRISLLFIIAVIMLFGLTSSPDRVFSKDTPTFKNSGTFRMPVHLLAIGQVSETPTETPTEIPESPTATPTEIPVEAPTSTPTESPVEEPTSIPTESPVEEPTPTESPVEEPTPTESPVEEPTPTESPVEVPTSTPTEEPAPTSTPTESPAEEPTPTESPVEEPTPTESPVEEPTPTESPVEVPTSTPTEEPAPTSTPTESPVEEPTPTESPVEVPTSTPTEEPAPTSTPTESPVEEPTPTESPVEEPTPTESPVEVPTSTPTEEPAPTSTPTESPVEEPTSTPTEEPEPTSTPTEEPETTSTPTESPVDTPTPSVTPSPTATPSPTGTPTPTTTPTPTNTPTPTPHVFPNSNQGILLLDGFGGFHEVGDIAGFYDADENGQLDDPETTQGLFSFVAPRDLYRDTEVYIKNNQVNAVLAARGDGLILSARFNRTGTNVTVETNFIASLGVTFNSSNVVVDVEFTENGSGYFVLLNDGSVYRVEGRNGQPKRVVNSSLDPTRTPAVDMEIMSENGTNINGYILTAKGRIITLGDAPILLGSETSINIFRDMELYEGQAIVADAFGGFKIIKPASSDTFIDVPLPELNFGAAVLRDFEIQVDEANASLFGGVGIVATTDLGTLHTSGAADFFLTDEGLARRPDLEVVTRDDGSKYIDLGITFPIIKDIELYILLGETNGQ